MTATDNPAAVPDADTLEDAFAAYPDGHACRLESHVRVATGIA